MYFVCFTAFSPLADLKLLQKLMPTFSVSVQMMQSYLDLQAFWQKLNQLPAFKFPYEGETKSIDLFVKILLVKCISFRLNIVQ